MGERGFEWKALFEPRSVAVIGASSTPGKIGMLLTSTLVAGGFEGEIYPVNPNAREVLGLKAYPSINQISGDVDLAIVVVPAERVVKSVEECAEKGVRWCIVITAGFKETGEEGGRMQEELARICKESGMGLVGPNCMGVFSASSNLHVLMNPLFPHKGNVSIISQSGTVGMMLMDALSKRGSGVARFVSSGNEAYVTVEDYLAFFAHDPETKVVVAFIEGIKDGRRFMRVAREVTENKPFICLKGGSTEAGARATRSHTASMAGSIQVFRGVAKQVGVTLAADCEELIDLAVAFSLSSLPEGRRVGIVTGGGGWGVLTADACEEHGLEVARLPESLIDKISSRAPPYWSRSNPVDLVASMDRELYAWCYDVVLGEGGVDVLIVENMAYDVSEGVKRILNLTEAEAESLMDSFRKAMVSDIVGVMKKHGKPVFVVAREEKLLRELADSGVPAFMSPSRVAKCTAKMVEYHDFKKRKKSFPSIEFREGDFHVSSERVAEFFRGAYAGIDGVWFMCVEEKYGLSEAAKLDAQVWSVFAKILAKRIMREFNIKGDSLDTLVRTITLRWKMEKWKFEVRALNDQKTVIIVVHSCPWLNTLRKAKRDHVVPSMCGEVCEAVYKNWAETVNPNITLERAKRMGNGDPFCEFKYTITM